ncbi:hypothetical protein CERZMDRAFT_43407 [Cercospora zeae-maydis SCOH1-5]|uniref:DUF7924 domain-containing protein n=1 Tax=Cercospora zeae-maydis SCOH1-5 TaxID=717836 RepID=A0A6A6FDE6_9PEZI|nr:hypothetical protein CERZMDRAFT_43407 [Cercospora zeae-maydis SCOH1-5]
MSQSTTRSRKRDHSSSVSRSSGRTKTTTPYSGEFEQKLIDRGMYPKGYRIVDGLRPPKPNNMSEICEILGRPRASLSPSTFSAAVFEDFQETNESASSEMKAMAHVVPLITGPSDCQFNSAADTAFHRLKKFDPELSVPKPDRYYGAKPAQIDGRVRRELNQYIIPSNRTDLPAAPSFFFEGKSASGRPDVAQRQAMYDSAVGARGILHLQNYGKPTQIHDGNAYTMSATYHPGTGTLQMYATHPRESTKGETEYHMTQLGAYAMTNAPETFRTGAAAYRNAREWTQRQRDRFISDANAAALRTSTESVPISRSESNPTTSLDAAGLSFDSETSTDELALGHAVSAKRPRSSLSQ